MNISPSGMPHYNFTDFLRFCRQGVTQGITLTNLRLVTRNIRIADIQFPRKAHGDGSFGVWKEYRLLPYGTGLFHRCIQVQSGVKDPDVSPGAFLQDALQRPVQ
jgi:hypothetical protein